MKKPVLPFRIVRNEFIEKLKSSLSAKENEVKSATDFIREIEKGNLHTAFTFSEKIQSGMLAGSLLSMRDQMKRMAEEEKERNWATEGLATFVEILRINNNDLQTLAQDIISHLVKYMQANQGALFIANYEDEKTPYLELTACYAYDKKKFLHKKISSGEGLVGQAFLEKDTIYLTDIPANYIRITSGLGQALPGHVLMVPLQVNNEVFGIVELASFHEIKPYQRQFVEKLGESIASTISTVKMNERTQKLLTESQLQAEHMRSQEEEMRQNLEELSATQEEMQRIIREVNSKEAYLNDLINATQDSIITVDHDLKVISCNQVLKKTYQSYGLTVDKGFDVMQLFSEAQQPIYQSYYKRALSGENFEVTEHYKKEDMDSFFAISYSPLRDATGQIIGAAAFAKDVTQIMLARQQTEKLLHDTQLQGEELKAQEEEMRQNLEELSATQEEMQRVLAEVQEKENYLNTLISSTADLIFTIDAQYLVVYYNKAVQQYFGSFGLQVVKGFQALNFFTEEQKPVFQSYYDKALAGETLEITNQYNIGGQQTYYAATYSPLRNEAQEITGVAIFAKNVTETLHARKEVERLLADEKLRSASMEANRQVLLGLNKSNAIHEGNWEAALEQITSTIAGHLHLSRVGIWAYNQTAHTITCLKLFTADNKAFSAGTELSGKDFPAYFEAVLSEEIIAATDAHQHPATCEFTEVYLKPLNISSMLDVPYFIDGSLGGVICCEQQFQARPWNSEEISFIKSVADTIPVAFKAYQVLEEKKRVNDINEKLQVSMAVVKEKEQYMQSMFNASTDSIYTINKSYRIVYANQALRNSETGKYLGVQPGFDSLLLFTEAERPVFKQHIDKALAGETVEITHPYKNAVAAVYLNTIFSPLVNEAAQIEGAVVFVKNVTQFVEARTQVEHLLKSTQQQTEELKAQEEELRQNMEEMQATQEELSRKNAEIEAIQQVEKERADNQINAQKKIMEAFVSKAKAREAALLEKITALEKKHN